MHNTAPLCSFALHGNFIATGGYLSENQEHVWRRITVVKGKMYVAEI